MKRTITSFFGGMLSMLLIGSLAVSGLASDGTFSITASPIHVVVNGEVFQPKDAAGNDALVFVYDGTTYAPLRALAEAYGLQVGYDSTRNMATVCSTATDFASHWTVAEKPVTNNGSEKVYTAVYNGTLSMDEFKVWWKSTDYKADAERMAAQVQSPGNQVTMYFSYGTYNLGTVFAFDTHTSSDFGPAGVWIK